jgi:hypothetical protein
LPQNEEVKIKFKSRMKIFLLLSALTFPGLCSFGQVSIEGKITDGRQTLPAVTVLLLELDSTVVKGIITDSNGEFIFENVASRDYLISASMVGYSGYLSPPIQVRDKNTILPNITLEEVSTKLEEVIVKADKQLFDQQIDRLVINLESSVTLSGNTILEVLQKSPGVVVNKQNNSITMNGKSGVQIMINGKAMQLSLDVIVQMLDGMNASNIDKIELITAPPAKYDAEGNAGIIHIVTKKDADLGTNGSIGLTLGARWAETLGGNFNLNHRNKNLAFFLDYSILRNHNLHIMKMRRRFLNNEFAQTVSVDSHRENVTNQQNVNTGIEWKLSANSLVNLSFTGYRRNWNLSANTNDVYHMTTDSTLTTEMKIDESNVWQSANGSFGIATKIDEKNEISLNLDYLYYRNDNPSFYSLKSFYRPDSDEVSEIDLKKTTPIRFFIARADYQYQLSPSFVLEAGIKGITSTLDNNVWVQHGIDKVWTTDSRFTSQSTLNEQVGAGYVSAKWQAATQWQINSGLRYEYTNTTIGTPVEKNLVNRKYGYLFPNFSVKKNLDAEQDLQFSYSRRITRPTYNDIAPYVFFWGPNTFSAGNTALYPAIADAVAAGYHVKQWIISLQFSHTRNEIAALQSEIDSESNIISRSQNLKYLKTLGLTNSYSVTIAPWWELQSNFSGQYQIARTSHLQKNATLNLYGFSINIVNVVRLPKDFSFEISGMYQSSALSGISRFMPLGSLNAGIQKKLGERSTIRLSMDDILYTNYWRIRTYSPENNLDSHLNYNWHNQFIRLTCILNLGNNKLQSVKLRSGSEEERKRIRN